MSASAQKVRLRRLVPLAATIAALIALALPSAALAAPPTLTINPPSPVETTKVGVSGEIDAHGIYTEWVYEVSTNGSDWLPHYEAAGAAVGPGAEAATGTLTGLTANQAYEVRLAATPIEGDNAYQPFYSSVETFKTDPAPVAPTATVSPATDVTYTTATVSGSVDPEGGNKEDDGTYIPIHWSLQLRDATADTPYEERGYGDLTEEQSKSNEPIDIGSIQLTGLTPGHTYHYYLLTTRAGIPLATGAIESFTTVAVPKPEVSDIAVTDITADTAHLSATVDPGAPTGPLDDEAKAVFETHWHFECEPSCEGLKGGTLQGESGSDLVVADDAKGLLPATFYTVRLFATNAGGTTKVTETFPTPGSAPLVIPFEAGPLTATGGYLNGEVNARNSATNYWFEWGTEDCSANPCQSTPHLPAANDELQQIVVTADAGTFTLSYGGETTPELPWNAAATEVEAALTALPAVGVGNVTVTGGAADVANVGSQSRYRVTFTRDLAATNLAQIAGPGASTVLQGGYSAFPTHVSHHLTGLEPQTTYHFRLLARNASGVAVGPDRSFTTPAPEPPCTNQGMPGADRLPDCRAYELVSPPQKNGVEVIPQTNKVHVRPDGNLVTFSSLGGFGELEGSAFDFEYMAKRTGQAGTNGWSSHGLNPTGHGATFTAVDPTAPTFYNGFTADLSAGIYKTWRPLVDAPNVADTSNLYRITGLDGGKKSIQLLTDSFEPLPVASWTATIEGTGLSALYLPAMMAQTQPRFAAVSTDLSHVVFQSALDLTADAPSYPDVPSYPLDCSGVGVGCPAKLYENADGVVRLLGRIPQAPDSACDDLEGPTCVAADSSAPAIEIYAYPQLTLSNDGRRVFFRAPVGGGSGPLYLREDGVRTFQIASDAQFFGASEDGSRAFFTTSEQLLPADTDPAPDVYMYEVEKPEAERLTLVSAGDSGNDGHVETVIGSNPDGHTLYFVDDQQLVAGQPPISIMGLYRWNDGDLDFLGTLPDGSIAQTNSPLVTASFPATAKRSRITPDGRHLLFMTSDDLGFAGRGGLSGFDHAGTQQFYLYDSDTGRLLCATCDLSGAPPTADAVLLVQDNQVLSQSTTDSALVLDDDGRRVFFNSDASLLPEDTNGAADAYEYDVSTGALHLLSSGTDPSPSYYVESTPDGSDAYIVTRERLSAWDLDTAYDLYDARVDGGFPEPAPRTDPCRGDSCRPAPHPSPADSSPPSGSPSAGNPPRKCPKGTRRISRKGKVRCVKRKHHHKHGRRAGRDRRASR